MRDDRWWIGVLVVCGGLALACSDGGGGGGGGAETDAGDGSSDDSNVTIRVSIGDTPLADVDVVFHAPDGAVTSHVTTDATGEARATIVGGSQVTVARSTPDDGFELYTYRSVDPGDTLLHRYRDGTLLAEAEVALPGDVADAADYRVGNGCGSPEQSVDGTATVTLMTDASCVDGSTPAFPVYAIARDETQATLAWSFAPSVPVSAPDAVLPPWQTGFDNVTAHFVNVPPDLWALSTGGGFQVGKGDFNVNGGLFASPSGDQTATFIYPQLAASSYVTTAIAHYADLTSWAFLVQGHAEAASERTYDLEGLLPPITSVTRDGTPARPGLRWTGGAPDADVQVASFRWASSRWTIYDAAGDADSVQAPGLPAELADHAPDADVEAGTISFYEVDWIDGYEDLKAAGNDLVVGSGNWRMAFTSAQLD
jgi:hypothetical protein